MSSKRMVEYRGNTNKVYLIKLPSTVSRVVWEQCAAAPGGVINLQVFTHYVGNGSLIKVHFSDRSGKKFGKCSGKIYGDYCSIAFKVPMNARDELYATVSLSKHGLKMKSSGLGILPPLGIINARWDREEIGRKDIVRLTAEVRGVADRTEVTIKIYEHDPGGAHEMVTQFPAMVNKKKVEAEWKYDYHDDVALIPQAEERYCFFQVHIAALISQSGLLKCRD